MRVPSEFKKVLNVTADFITIEKIVTIDEKDYAVFERELEYTPVLLPLSENEADYYMAYSMVPLSIVEELEKQLKNE